MGDRAMCHIRIGGALRADMLPAFRQHIADYDLRNDWSGDDPDFRSLQAGKPLDLYGEELNGGTVPALEAFCRSHHLPFRRWSGGCQGAFDPALYAFYGPDDEHSSTASDNETPVFSAEDIARAETLEALRATIALFERDLPPFAIIASSPGLDSETAA